jgi:hypothetical protein
VQAYEGYFRDGQFFPLGEAVMPEGMRVIVTVLDESRDNVSQRQKAALARFRENVRNSEPLPPEFDELMSRRVNITRELDL